MWQAELLNIIAGTLSVGVTPSTASYESIATVTVGSGGSSTIEFTSIPSTYTHLQMRFLSLDSRNLYDDSPIDMQFNSDTGSNYSRHSIVGDGTVYAQGATSQSFIRLLGGTISSYFAGGVVDILDYTSTSKTKTVRCLAGSDKNGSGFVTLISGLWFATPAAITSIKLTPFSAPFKQYTQFALYGIKGS